MSTRNAFHDFFIMFDSIGPVPGISTNGNSRFATIFGALFTIISYLIVLIAFRDDIKDVFKEENPTISLDRKPNNEALLFNQTGTRLLFYELRYIDINTNAFVTVERKNHPKTFIYYTDYNSSAYQLYNISDEKNNSTMTYLESCETNNIFDKFNENTGGQNISIDIIKEKQKNALCYPSHISYPLISKIEQNSNILFFLNYNEMAKLYEIYKSDRFILVINSLEVNLDANDSKNPYKLIWKENWVYIDPNKSKMVKIKMESFVGYKDLTKFIFSDELPPTNHYFVNEVLELFGYTNLHYYPEELKILYDTCLMMLLDYNQRNTEMNLRYKSFDFVLGNIGGLASIIFPFIEGIFVFFVDPFYQAERLNSVFSFHENLKTNEEVNEVIRKFTKNSSYLSSNVRLGRNGRNGIYDKISELSDNKVELDDNKINNHSNNLNLSNNSNPDADHLSNNKQANQLEEVIKNELLILNNKNNDKNNDNNDNNDNISLQSSNRNINIMDKSPQLGNKIELTQLSKYNKYNKDLNNINNDNNDNNVLKLPIDDNIENNTTPNDDKKHCNKDNKLLSLIKKKRQTLITCSDVCKTKYCLKSNDSKSSIIKKCLEYLDSTLDEQSIGINSIRYSLLFKMMFESNQREIFHIPSININLDDNHLLEELIPPEKETNLIEDDEIITKNAENIQVNRQETSPGLSELDQKHFDIAKSIKLDTKLNKDLIENYLKSNL